MLSNAMPKPWSFYAWHSLAAPARGGAGMMLVLAGLLEFWQPTAGAEGRFVNISTRALVETGEEVMIAGFIIENGARPVLIQAVGPELANSGIANALADPVLTVIQTSEGEPPRAALDPPIEFMVNDNWEDSQGELVSDIWGGSPNLTAGSLSSAAVLTLGPGEFTAKVEGKDGITGVAIVEVYGIDSAGAVAQFVNLSTRALVKTGEEVMIAGFIIEDGPRQVLVQAVGPELANAGIANVLADPVLTVIQTGEGEPPRAVLDPPIELMVNDNWEDSQGELVSDIWGGSPNLEAGSLSAAAFLTLDPGAYTAMVEGKDGTTGVAIVEVYEIDSPDTGSQDREVLTALYNGTDGANWTNNENWLMDAPLDQWHGVSVDDNGCVIGLNLSANQLSGPIPSELGNLANLQSLFLSDNQLSGPIPDLGSLSNLRVLYLHKNELSGPIPAELGNLANLKLLDLPNNQLSGSIPSELGNLINLTTLDLSKNQLSGPIPVELGNLANLQTLSLGSNELGGQIPLELGNLASLDTLGLSSNQLSGPIPAELGSLSNLIFLFLSDNELSGPIPPELGNLSNLIFLVLSDNQLNDPIPPALGNLAKLQILDLHANQLSGPIPAELGGLSNLKQLFLGGNQLSGCIPDGLRDVAESDLSTLGLLYCGAISIDRAALVALYNATDGPNWTNSANWLSDAPLDQWHGVTIDASVAVTGLNLANNNLTGSIPAELGELANLQSLSLNGNELSGPIPAELGNLVDLRFLSLSRNDLNGPIPPELGNLVNLQNLDLNTNQLSGTIPAELGRLASLARLALYDNQLNGLIPAKLGSLANLEVLNLGGNQLSGPIPAALGNLSKLVVLYLWVNELSGSIPVELGGLANLETLDLHFNQLSGSIPAALGNLSKLENLYLWENELIGPIPTELGNLPKLVLLDLSSNRLSGPVPAELGNLANLEGIYLGGNQLSDCIPNGLRDVAVNDLSTLGLPYCGTISSDRAALIALYNATDGSNWTNSGNWLTEGPLGDWQGVTTDATTGRVVGLSLPMNNLTGPIPPEMGDLGDVLLVLDLAGNQLSGPVPANLGYLANLEAIYLASNQLSGCIPNGLRDVEEGDLSTLGLQYCGTISSDQAALVAFFHATNGPNWANSFNWLSEASLRDWHGITTDFTTGRVVGLSLPMNNLTGPIPADLGNLDKLRSLVLTGNQLSGQIPVALGNLANLETIFLGVNQLSGCIPSRLQAVVESDLSTLGLQYCGTISND